MPVNRVGIASFFTPEFALLKKNVRRSRKLVIEAKRNVTGATLIVARRNPERSSTWAQVIANLIKHCSGLLTKAKADKASGEARKNYDEAVEKVGGKQKAIREQLEEFKTASAKAWEELEKNIDAGLEELKKLYEKARSASISRATTRPCSGCAKRRKKLSGAFHCFDRGPVS